MRSLALAAVMGLAPVLGCQTPATVHFPTPGDWQWEGIHRVGSREATALATDPVRGRVVLFGGTDAGGTRYRSLMEWDGSTWRDATTSPAPSPRIGHSMAWDPVNREVLLFGGYTNGLMNNETWTWDGLRWRQWSPGNRPWERDGASIATDPVRARVVLFGGLNFAHGFLNDTWEWTGNDWICMQPAVSPSSRDCAPMAWCSITGRTVLFGGARYNYVPPDTWEWDGVTWRQVPMGPNAPPDRCGAGMAALPDGSLVMHGGEGSIIRQNDTWRWDGTSWTQLMHQATLPPMRQCNLAQDPVNQSVLHLGALPAQGGWYITSLLGGNGWIRVWDEADPNYMGIIGAAVDKARDERVMLSSGRFGIETYVLDAANRTRRAAPSTAGPPLPVSTLYAYANFAYHEADRVCVLFSGNFQNQTWLWDGQRWTLDARPVAPPAQASPGYYCYDGARRKVVCLARGTLDHWEYDVASGWTLRPVPNRPTARVGMALAYAPDNGHLVLYGGGSLRDTWEFDGSTWYDTGIVGTDILQHPQTRLVYSEALQACVMVHTPVGRDGRRRPLVWIYDHRSWRRLDTDVYSASSVYVQADTLAYDKEGGIDLVWGSGLLAEFLASLRFPTLGVGGGPRFRAGDTVPYHVQVPRPGPLFLPLMALDNAGGVRLPALGVGTTGSAVSGLVPLAPDGLFVATVGSSMVLLDAAGNGSGVWRTPAVSALSGLRVYLSGVHLDSSLRVDWIATSRWIEFL